jgi:nicotinate-nucleotide pyrophosphorylase (carboxylating)
MDTRKTAPGLRAFEKYAVTMGGGFNHRLGLDDAILVKDNHIKMAGGIDPAIEAARSARDRVAWLEVEVTNLEELQATLKWEVDAVLLDNMRPEMVRQAVEMVRARRVGEKPLVEASGGITLENVRRFAETGVDWISVGALTHSAPAVDISFEIEPA